MLRSCALALTCFFLPVVLSVGDVDNSLPSLNDDTTCSIDEPERLVRGSAQHGLSMLGDFMDNLFL